MACRILKQSRSSYARSVRLFEEGGAERLFAPRINPHRKFDSEQVKKGVVQHPAPAASQFRRQPYNLENG
ncbi:MULTISPECIES: hypothetical protein [Bradyrhizobium]|uniref:hypothetical protein n=1 Tax=Bradyrhizobium TaxID=374 RepID=UPI0034E4FF72